MTDADDAPQADEIHYFRWGNGIGDCCKCGLETKYRRGSPPVRIYYVGGAWVETWPTVCEAPKPRNKR